MKFYDFIVLGLWITSLSFVNISKEFIQGAVTAAVICGYIGWRIRK
nr:MAG TPA: hypothetical protein [Caudoviricetes sp.]